MQSSLKRLVGAAIAGCVLNGGALAAQGVTVTEGAGVAGTTTFTSSDWNLESGTTGSAVAYQLLATGTPPLGQALSFLNNLQIGETYTISFSAVGSGFLDVYTLPYTLAEADGYLALSGQDDGAFAATAQTYFSGLDTEEEVFRIDNTAAKNYAFSFVANATQANLYLKSTSPFLEGSSNSGVTLGATVMTAVPEPETYAMMLAGLGAMGLMARRRRVK